MDYCFTWHAILDNNNELRQYQIQPISVDILELFRERTRTVEMET